MKWSGEVNSTRICQLCLCERFVTKPLQSHSRIANNNSLAISPWCNSISSQHLICMVNYTAHVDARTHAHTFTKCNSKHPHTHKSHCRNGDACGHVYEIGNACYCQRTHTYCTQPHPHVCDHRQVLTAPCGTQLQELSLTPRTLETLTMIHCVLHHGAGEDLPVVLSGYQSRPHRRESDRSFNATKLNH